MLILIPWWFLLFWTVEGVVFDPALYLSPSPPMTSTQEENPWYQPKTERSADLAVIPVAQIITTMQPTSQPTPSVTTTTSAVTTTRTTEVQHQEPIEKSDKLWQLLRNPGPRVGPYLGIHVPLTFSLTGTYGGYGTGNVGVVGSSYGSVSDIEDDSGMAKLYGNYMRGLAGSSYGAYGGYGGTRIYGSDTGAAWSGWGNGKWGHYGKG